MPFMVIFHSDGKPGYHQVDELDGALRFVEHLRNTEGVDNATIYRLEEVAIEVRTVYKVELAKAPSDEAPPEPAADEPRDVVDDDEADREAVASGSRRGIFR